MINNYIDKFKTCIRTANSCSVFVGSYVIKLELLFNKESFFKPNISLILKLSKNFNCI